MINIKEKTSHVLPLDQYLQSILKNKINWDVVVRDTYMGESPYELILFNVKSISSDYAPIKIRHWIIMRLPGSTRDFVNTSFYIEIKLTQGDLSPEQVVELDNYVSVINQFLRKFRAKYKFKLNSFLQSSDAKAPSTVREKINLYHYDIDSFTKDKVFQACDEYIEFFKTLSRTDRKKFLPSKRLRSKL